MLILVVTNVQHVLHGRSGGWCEQKAVCFLSPGVVMGIMGGCS